VNAAADKTNTLIIVGKVFAVPQQPDTKTDLMLAGKNIVVFVSCTGENCFL